MGPCHDLRVRQDLQIIALLLLHELLDRLVDRQAGEVGDGFHWEYRQYLLEHKDRVIDVHEILRLDAILQAL